MYNLGPWFKSIRKRRKLTLKEVSENIITPSFLSKFERGESDITLDIFLKLTERLNITLDEIVFMQNNYKLGKIEFIFKEIRTCYLNRDFNSLQNLVNLLEKENIKAHNLTNIMIKILMKDLNSSYEVSQEDIYFLTEYLFEVEQWGIYELYLFGNSLSSLTKETVILFSKELAKKTSNFIEIKRFKEQFIKIVQNIVIFCLENNELDYVLENITLIETLTNNSTMYFEKIKSKYLYGIYLIHMGLILEGTEMAKYSINLMNEFGDSQLAKVHEQYLNKVLNKYH